MEYVYEVAVMHYLTRMGDVFLCPQFPIRDEKGGLWSTPDFVALDFAKKTVEIVEVSSASDVSSLRQKVINRDSRWMAKIRKHLAELDAAVQNWPIGVRVFAREANLSRFEKLAGETTVVTQSLESVMCNWKWEW